MTAVPSNDVRQRILLSTSDVVARLGISRTTIWEAEKRGAFPKALYLNRRCKRWRIEDLDAYIDQQGAGR